MLKIAKIKDRDAGPKADSNETVIFGHRNTKEFAASTDWLYQGCCTARLGIDPKIAILMNTLQTTAIWSFPPATI